MAIIFRNINGNAHTPIDTETGDVAFDETNINAMSADELKERLQRELPDEKPVVKGKDKKSQAEEENKTSILEQISAHIATLNKMNVLQTIPESEIITDFTVAATKLRAELDKNKGFVFREGFGDIQISKRIFSAKKYLKSANEIAAIAAIPIILQKGIVVGKHGNHKNRGYETITFAGKVGIGRRIGFMGITVKRTTGNFYVAHRVSFPDGQVVEI